MAAPNLPQPPIGEPPPLLQIDDRASREAAAFANGQLQRSDTRDKHFHYCALVFLWCAFGAFIVTAGIWLYHLLTPAAWHFLTDPQRENVQNILFTAVGSTTAGAFGKNYLGTKNSK